MENLKFKSLTMRIWSYFIVMIIVIVIIFLAINSFMISSLQEDMTFKDLQTYQNVISRSNYNRGKVEEELDNYKNLTDMDYFLVIENKNGFKIINDNSPNDKKFFKDNTIHNNNMHDKKSSPKNNLNLLHWMSSYINKVKNNPTKFSESFEGKKTIFLIKRLKTNSDSYMIAYSYRLHKEQNSSDLLYISLMIILLGLIVSKLISNNLSKPLKKLELYTEKIAKKEWYEPLPIEREDEIGRLICSMNKMQTSLKIADEEQQAFLQSISHDLKTPVMVIKSYAEAIIDGIYIEDLDDTAKIISSEASKLEHKIKQLIYFNSLNYMMENEKIISDVRMDLLFKDLQERLKLIRSDIAWELNLEEVLLHCNKDNITVAFENIIDNQLRYAESKISIKLSKIQNKIMIEIYNDGPHIKEENLNRIFDKFYKEKKGNFGLGLAISQKIIEFYNGTIHANNAPKGVSFIIEIK